MKNHIESQHSQVFECTLCQLILSTKSYINQHVTASHPDVKDISTVIRNRLTKHSNTSVKQKTIHQCEECKFTSDNTKTLYYHIATTHQDPINCDICQEAFQTTPSLQPVSYTHLTLPTKA